MNYLIDFKNTVSEEDIQSYLSANGYTVVKTFNKFEKVFLVQAESEPVVTDIIETVICDDTTPLELLGTIITSDQTFGKIVTDGSVPTAVINNDDQNWWKFYTLSDPDLDKPSLIINRRGISSTVYLLDSGVDVSHPEFAGVSVENLWSFNGNFNDSNGHGTAIASVISGNTCGVTNAKIKSVKIFEKGTPTKQSDLLTALDVIYLDFINNNFNSKSGNAIVNASWSVAKNEYIETKIRTMHSAGILFVVSSGNDGSVVSDRTPASMPEVLTIGAYNNNLVPCDFSNYTGGSAISVTPGLNNYGQLDGWAPGEKIWAACNNGYSYVAGTSIAAGIASAVIAYNLDVVNEPIYETPLTQYFNSFALLRTDLLDLSDPKYSNSVNSIVTFRETMPPSFGRRNPIHTNLRGFSGAKFVGQLFCPWLISELEILSDLPETLEITPQGKIFGKSPVLNPEEGYRLLKIPLRVKYNDGVEETLELGILVTPDANIETLGDPELDIYLASTCIYFGAPCVLSCIDSCPMILVCDEGQCTTKGQISCTCIL